MFCKSVCSL